MAVKKKGQKKGRNEPLLSPETLEAMHEDIGDLYKQHEEELMDVLDESEDKKVTITFAVQIDKSETEPQLKTTLRFSTSVTDSRLRTLSNPMQPELVDVKAVREASREAKAKERERERKKSGKDAAANPGDDGPGESSGGGSE